MGREIRRVPENWEHPKKDDGQYHPMFESDFNEALIEWVHDYNLWNKGAHPDQKKWPEEKNKHYHKWAGSPPDPEYYNHCKGEKTWYQMYETVSEGTPVTPPFKTESELVDYLVDNGTFWDPLPWGRENAEHFVKSGWAPSGIAVVGSGRVFTARDVGELNKEVK